MDNLIQLEGEIYVLISFLEKYGVNSQTVQNGLLRNRKLRSEYFIHFHDSINKKKVWIKYSSLTPQLFIRYKLPSHHELIDIENEQVNSKTKNLINSKLSFAYNFGYKKFIKHFYGVFHELEVLTSYARTHCVFSHCLELKQYGIDIKDIFPEYLKLKGLQFETLNIKSFYQKLKDYEMNGCRIFIHKSYGNSRGAIKLTIQHRIKIEELYMHSDQLSGREIHLKLNLWAVKNGFSKVSLSTIKKILSDVYLQNRCKPHRNGAGWKKNLFDPFTLRIQPQCNGTLWEIDGSRLQIPYLNDGKPGFLNYFVVMDIHSGKIVGYSIDKSENIQMILDSLKMAIKNCGYVPLEILMDHASSYNHKKFKDFEEQISLLGTQFRKHIPGNPRDKGHVERFVSTFQSTICKGVDGYIGEGVKSRREEGRPDDKLIYEALKSSNLRSRNELEKTFEDLINQYNELKINNKPSPRTKFEVAKTDEYASEVSDNEFALLFWSKIHEYQIKNSMIIITEGSFRENSFQYVIEDNEWRLKLNFTKVIVCYSKTDRSMIKLFDKNEQHIMDVQRTKPVPIVFRKTKKPLFKENICNEEMEVTGSKNKNQLYKKPETLDVFFIKTKNNE